MTTSVKTGYAPVNGLELYHEIRGAGDPLVLLHGGVVGMTMFDAILPELAGGRQVISVDLQGHGRTADALLCRSRSGIRDRYASSWSSQSRGGARAGTQRSGPISTGWPPPPASS